MPDLRASWETASPAIANAKVMQMMRAATDESDLPWFMPRYFTLSSAFGSHAGVRPRAMSFVQGSKRCQCARSCFHGNRGLIPGAVLTEHAESARALHVTAKDPVHELRRIEHVQVVNAFARANVTHGDTEFPRDRY